MNQNEGSININYHHRQQKQLPVIKAVDYIEPAEVWFHLAQEPFFVFLDSASRPEDLGRFSYIAFDPFLIIKSQGQEIFINEKKIIGNPFHILNEQLQQFKTTPLKDLPPFQGGALGYFAYDLLHHLEKIPPAANNRINIPDLYVGFYDCILAFDQLLNQAWIISQGFPETELQARQKRAEIRASAFWQLLSRPPIAKKRRRDWKDFPTSSVISNFSQQDFHQTMQKVLHYIYEGDIFQANIAQCFSMTLPPELSTSDIYAALREKNPSPFSAFLQFTNVCLASSSPERFLKLQNNWVETRPIKGTIARGKNQSEDNALAQILLESEKDRAENTMIVDLMRNDLSKICQPDSVQVTQLCQLETYATVHHLVSVIEAELMADKNAVDLLQATFPGGSITGAPKIRAMEIIYELEPYARTAYCGCIGFIGFDGNMDTSIVIRSLIFTENQIYFQTGCGIVADSDPQKEYEESLTKAAALLKVLQGKLKTYDFVD